MAQKQIEFHSQRLRRCILLSHLASPSAYIEPINILLFSNERRRWCARNEYYEKGVKSTLAQICSVAQADDKLSTPKLSTSFCRTIKISYYEKFQQVQSEHVTSFFAVFVCERKLKLTWSYFSTNSCYNLILRMRCNRKPENKTKR